MKNIRVPASILHPTPPSAPSRLTNPCHIPSQANLQVRLLHCGVTCWSEFSPPPCCSFLTVVAQVDVSRSVIDQYGTMEWEVTFTMNLGTTPPGAGDVEALSVVQNVTLVEDYAGQPIVTETQQGSTGLSGTFSLDYNDPGGVR